MNTVTVTGTIPNYPTGTVTARLVYPIISDGEVVPPKDITATAVVGAVTLTLPIADDGAARYTITLPFETGRQPHRFSADVDATTTDLAALLNATLGAYEVDALVTEAAIRAAADTALDGRVDALELAPPAHTHDDRYYTESEADTLLAAKATTAALTSHTGNTSNPHAVTAAQVGALTQAGADALYAQLTAANLFTQRQDIRASGAGLAAGLHVPWVSGDSAPALTAGASTSGNNQTGVQGISDSSIGVQGTSTSGEGIRATSTSGPALVALLLNTGTSGVSLATTTRRRTTGTPAIGYGLIHRTQLNSTTTADQSAADRTILWVDPTHASRRVRETHAVYDSGGAREYLRGESDGSAARLGFYGANAVTKPTITGSRGGNAALASLLTALANLGLITDSTTA